MRKIYLNFNKKCNTKINIMIFAEGTILKPKSLYNHNDYVPIGKAVELIRLWNQQGANIIFCTSRKRKQADDMANLLKSYGFIGDFLAVREAKEKVSPQIKMKIKSIVVPEFKDIDKLPHDLKLLKSY